LFYLSKDNISFIRKRQHFAPVKTMSAVKKIVWFTSICVLVKKVYTIKVV